MRQALDGDNAMSIGLYGIDQAGAYRLAIEHDRARAADTVFAADMRAREVEMFT